VLDLHEELPHPGATELRRHQLQRRATPERVLRLGDPVDRSIVRAEYVVGERVQGRNGVETIAEVGGQPLRPRSLDARQRATADPEQCGDLLVGEPRRVLEALDCEGKPDSRVLMR
jgi:hypothetical protein